MNLNNWLCKHLDEKKKRYVTIWDLIQYMVPSIAVFVLWLLYKIAQIKIAKRPLKDDDNR